MTQETMTKEQIMAKCNLYPEHQKGIRPRDGKAGNNYERIINAMSEWESQQLSAERERAGKLVEALKSIDRINYSQNISDIIEQTLNDYDTATKS